MSTYLHCHISLLYHPREGQRLSHHCCISYKVLECRTWLILWGRKHSALHLAAFLSQSHSFVLCIAYSIQLLHNKTPSLCSKSPNRGRTNPKFKKKCPRLEDLCSKTLSKTLRLARSWCGGNTHNSPPPMYYCLQLYRANGPRRLQETKFTLEKRISFPMLDWSKGNNWLIFTL